MVGAHTGAKASKLSQEHGILSLFRQMMKSMKVGDVLSIPPVHACATAVMTGEICTLEDENKLQIGPLIFV